MGKVSYLYRSILLLAALFGGTGVFAEQTQKTWSYEGDTGPEFWGSLSEDYVTCKTGKQQSPINVEPPRNWFSRNNKKYLPPLEFRYNSQALEIMNNEHTIKFDYASGGELHFGKRIYALKQFHLHTPSEHTERDRVYDMEIHLVHEDEAGEHAVVALLVLQGPRNTLLERVLPFTPTVQHKISTTPIPLNAWFLLPRYRDYYHYKGSLTEPPCTEGVNWFVMKYPIYASRDQIKFFQSIIGANARPKQAINNRKIQESEY